MIPANRFLFVILALVLAAGAASAQVPVGTPKFGSFGGGSVDTINLANLNAHFDIPVLHKPGRGLPFNFDLSYDTTFWQPVPTSPGMAWNPVPTAGWSGSALNVGSLGYSKAYSIALDGSFGIIAYYNFYYYDGFGTPHPWPSSGSACQRNTVDVAWVEWGNYCLLGFLFYNAPFTDTTKDGSGYTLSADACAYMEVLGYPSTCVGVGNLTSTDGNGIVPQNVTPLNPGATPGSVIDRNGNKINVDASGNYTDTLGTLALKAAGGAPNPYTLTYTSPAGPAGTPVSVTVTFASYTLKTNFSCPNIADYGPISNVSLVDRVTLPDGSYYQLRYEPTPGFPGDVTARLASITLPTGGTISYQYTGGNSGIMCADGSTAGLRRTTPDGVWTYDRTLGSGAASTTTVTDPQGNQTVIQFQGIYETQRQVYQGSSTAGTLLQTVATCYNGNTTNCSGTAIALPINQRAVTTQLGSNGLQAKQVYSYNGYGLPTQEDDYDYGSSGVGPLLKRTLYAYPLNLDTLKVKTVAQTVTVQDGLGNQVAQTTYNYDETAVVAPPQTPTPQHLDVGTAQRGNLTSVTSWVRGTTILRKTSTYYDTGNLQTSTDFNGAQTTYNYSSLSASCGNSFPTSVSEPLGLSKSMTWNCTGGVQTSGTDENSQPTTTAYNDPYFWRPASTTDPTNAVTNFAYPSVTSGEISLTFNSGASTSDLLETFDGLARRMLQQRRQAPGSINFDSVQSYYDSVGRPSGTSLPYSAPAGQQSPGGRAITKTYDALGRVKTVTDAGGGQVSYDYTQNDMLVTVGPAPAQENTKRRQMEYDALERLTSVCELTTVAQSGACGQTVPQTGYWTKYTYDALGNLTGVSQNAQTVTPPVTSQTRSYTYDGLSRLTSETNPESGAVSYTYDTDVTCGSSSGDRVKRVDAVGNTTCYAYDALHRVTSTTYSGPYAGSTPNKYFVYDAATINTAPTPTAMLNAKGRLAEAYTATCPTCAKINDLGYSYSVRGEVNDVYQSTPQSGGYYHLNETYWANGVPSQLSGNIGLPIINYGVDGEGRTSSVSAVAPAQNLVTGTLYNLASQPYQVNLGTGDSDAFGYDPNTARMNQYQFNVNSQSVTGTLTWNPNATLQTLAITDPFNTANTQTCTYSYDDLTRIAGAGCTPPGSPTPSVWQQSFSYDPFGNISKSGSMSFQPTYSPTTNRMTSLPGFTPTYDNNGNVLNDNSHQYNSWDTEGRPVTIDAVSLTYDALSRMVEQNRSGVYTQIVYAPTGEKLALMNGQTLQNAFVPLPAKVTAVYTSAGLSYYRHPDWLASSRFASTPARGMYSDSAYAPFGEPYAQAGTADLSFTGLNQDTVGGLYDAGAREYSIQGRWPSPDPAGQSSMHLTDPQTLDRYAYVRNNPLGYVDPSGLDWWDWGGGFFGGGGGFGFPGGGIWNERLPLPTPAPPPWLVAVTHSISNYFGIPDFTRGLPLPGTNEGWGGNSWVRDEHGNVVGESEGERICLEDAVNHTCTYAYWNPRTGLWEDTPSWGRASCERRFGADVICDDEGGVVRSSPNGNIQPTIAANLAMASAAAAAMDGVVGGLVDANIFGKGGILNSNQYLRIGWSRLGGTRVFRVGGKAVR